MTEEEIEGCRKGNYSPDRCRGHEGHGQGYGRGFKADGWQGRRPHYLRHRKEKTACLAFFLIKIMINQPERTKQSAQADLFFDVPATELCFHLHKILDSVMLQKQGRRDFNYSNFFNYYN